MKKTVFEEILTDSLYYVLETISVCPLSIIPIESELI